MNFFDFTLSVWAAIALGVFFLSIVLACTADRYGSERPKWFVLFIGAIVLGIMYWGDISWRVLLSAPFWKGVGIYAGIGLAYSILEFILNIRREERRWASSWQNFKKNHADTGEPSEPSGNSTNHTRQTLSNPREGAGVTLEQRFVKEHTREYHHTSRLVGIELDAAGNLTPVVNRVQLAQKVGCWTLFWPAYAVSLVLGDLFYEVCKKVADLLAALSTRAVRGAFSKTFTP